MAVNVYTPQRLAMTAIHAPKERATFLEVNVVSARALASVMTKTHVRFRTLVKAEYARESPWIAAI